MTYVLVQSHWSVTTLNTNDLRYLLQLWSLRINNTPTNFKTSKVVNNITHLNDQTFDMVFMTEKFWNVLIRKLSHFKSLINDHTMVIVESTESPWFYDRVNELLSNNIVLAIFSEISCRRLTLSANEFCLTNPSNEKLSITMGVLSNKFVKPNIQQRVDLKNPVASGLLESMKTAVSFFKGRLDIILSVKSARMLNKLIWKNLLLVVCFHCLSVIFEESNILKLAKMPQVVPIMKGSFQEILSICNNLELKALPRANSSQADRLLQVLILIESNTFLKLQSAITLNVNNMESNQLYYNFVNGNELSILLTLDNLMNLATQLHIQPTFLECISSFLSHLIQVRNTNHSKLFHLKRRLINLNPVNDIKPEDNMMNFPPFNPLPLPSPPSQFVSTPLVMMMANNDGKSENQEDKDSDSSSEVSIDSGVRSLFNGYTKRKETFYDTQPAPEPVSSPGPAFIQGPGQNSAVPFPPQQFPYQSQFPQPMPQPLQQPIPLFQPQYPPQYPPHFPPQVPYPPQPPGQTNGQYRPPQFVPAPLPAHLQSPVPPPNSTTQPPFGYHSPYGYYPYPFQGPPIKKRPVNYHHLQPTINRNTSIQQLRESHNGLLESVNFGAAMNNRIPNRYGRYDTSTTMLNSGNNSRSSHGNSSTHNGNSQK